MSGVSRKQSKVEHNDVVQNATSRANSRSNDNGTAVENGKAKEGGAAAAAAAGKSTKAERMEKYKEERRKQLGLIQVDSKQDSNKDSKVSGNSKRYITRSTRQTIIDNASSHTRNNIPKSPTKIPSKILASPNKEKTPTNHVPSSKHPTTSSATNSEQQPPQNHTTVQTRHHTLPKSPSKHLMTSSTTSTSSTTHANQTVRTTKASRLRAAASDKTPKDPTANEIPTTTATTTSTLQRRKPTCPALEPSASSKPPVDDNSHNSRNVRQQHRPTVATSTSKTNPNNNNHIANKRLVPSIDVCVKQTLSEFTVDQICSDISNRNFVTTDALTTVHHVNGNAVASTTEMASEEFLTSSLTFVSPRKRQAVKVMATTKSKPTRDVELSPVRAKRTPSASPKQSPKHISSLPCATSSKISPKHEKDKSSKRKSNLNKAQHEGVIENDDNSRRLPADNLSVIVLDDTLILDITPISTDEILKVATAQEDSSNCDTSSTNRTLKSPKKDQKKTNRHLENTRKERTIPRAKTQSPSKTNNSVAIDKSHLSDGDLGDVEDCQSRFNTDLKSPTLHLPSKLQPEDNASLDGSNSPFKIPSPDLRAERRTVKSPTKRGENAEKTYKPNGSRELLTDFTVVVLEKRDERHKDEQNNRKRHEEFSLLPERRQANNLAEELSPQKMADEIHGRTSRNGRGQPYMMATSYDVDEIVILDDTVIGDEQVVENTPEKRPTHSSMKKQPPKPVAASPPPPLSSSSMDFINISSDISFASPSLDIEISQPPTKSKHNSKKTISPMLRRKSIDDFNNFGGCAASNHIVSILKRKDAADSSSASSNTSPVTFSPSVVDTPIRSSAKQGILKKRSSLDESRYSRSHSPDEKSILVKGTRRNSFEEIQHGILKQTSYETKEEINQTLAHGILKKKESTTSNEPPKHVSISQAVILAAAELCQDMQITVNSQDDTNCDIRPILKADPQHHSQPKPILKKKYSSESEEIRPILKSRKSSREEFSDNEDYKRSILKMDSPAKRRSYIDIFDSNIVLERSRSLENPEPRFENGVIVPAVQTMEKPVVSVAERIKSMEQYLGAVPKLTPTRREAYKQRFKTQPVTVEEISSLKTNYDLFKPKALELPPLVLKTNTNLCEEKPFESLLLHHQSADKLSLSPTIESSQSLSTGELNLASLSSDSGIQFNKISEMYSGSGELSTKASDSEKSSPKHITSSPDDIDRSDKSTVTGSLSRDRLSSDNEKSGHDEDEESSTEKSGLKRNNSVKARANLFQQLENKLKLQEQEVVVKTPPRPRRTPNVNLQRKFLVNDEGSAETNTQKHSDDSGTEFEPSSLPLSVRMKIFTEMSQKKNQYNTNILNINNYNNIDSNTPRMYDYNPTLTTSSAPSSLIIDITPHVPQKRKLKVRLVGKLIMPNFLQSENSSSLNNNNKDGENNRNENENPSKIGRIKSVFFQASTPIRAKVDDNSSDFDSGKENDSGSESTVNGYKRNGSCPLSAVKNVSANKSLLINTPKQGVDESLAKYFGLAQNNVDGGRRRSRTRANTLEFSSKISNISEITQTTFQTDTNGGDGFDTCLSLVNENSLSFMTRFRAATQSTKFKTGHRNAVRSQSNGNHLVSDFDELCVTLEDLKNASVDFERLYVGAVRSSVGQETIKN